MSNTIKTEVFFDQPMGSALKAELTGKIVVTHSSGPLYLLDVLAKQPRALIVRENLHDVAELLASVSLRQGEGLYLGPALEHPPLTVCERRTLQFIAFGLSNSEIAQKVGREVSTVNTQVSSVLRKMDAKSRREVQALYWGISYAFI